MWLLRIFSSPTVLQFLSVSVHHTFQHKVMICNIVKYMQLKLKEATKNNSHYNNIFTDTLNNDDF